MTTLTLTARDSGTMLRRTLVHMRRYPSLTLMLIGIPVVFLLLFVYVFGQTLGSGLPGAALSGRAAYVGYVTPGILLIAVAGAAQGTAITVAMDLQEGIVARFRTMAIARSSVLTGHVVGAALQAYLCVAVVLGVALLIGFRPDATPVEWLAAAGLIGLLTLAVTWFSVWCGLVADSVETASNLPMPLLLLPFLSSGFVPTDSMPRGLAWVAEYQPFTPVIETLRGLLLGSEIGSHGWLAVAWCLVATAFFAFRAIRRYDRL